MWFQVAPQWLAEERWLSMQVHDQVLKSTVFIGYKGPRGEFVAEGTGFIFNISDSDLSFGYVATCAHVARDSAQEGTEHERKVCISFNKKGGGTRVVDTNILDWNFHKDKVDACLHGAQAEWDEDDSLDTSPIDISSIFNEGRHQVGLSLGDDLFIAGLWVGRQGQKKNLPIIRVANLASKPDEPIWPAPGGRPAYLIETRSLGGTSGSPVFLHALSGHRFRSGPVGTLTEKAAILPYLAIGMIQGAHASNYRGEFIDGDGERSLKGDSQFNAGISIAVPIDQIVEITEYDKMKAERRKEIDARLARVGYRPSGRSASRDNSSHREDFTSLLNAAAKTKPQDGQT